MIFGGDFFKVVQFIMALLKLISRCFGDEEDKILEKKHENNLRHELEAIVNGATKKN